ncbi:actinodin3 [Cyprinodon tularosa]|uniref:actinodin3 n=1 Tax=Cyprinodon tularosa TaxID=77115 RepID=UPI0018E201F9|nr:actinodin3 [Cyprinodon tularosa]
MMMWEQMSVMFSLAFLLRALCCLLLMPGFLGATSLLKIKRPDENPVRIGSAEANDFLTNPRSKRNVDPKWYRRDPDFQSYYRLYNSIGHIEGLYEIDRIRMLYQQMRHLELTNGPDASHYQNRIGVLTSTEEPPTTTHPPAPPTTPTPTPDQLEEIYLCNPKDPLCKPHVVYLPTGAVPILCDPRLNPVCRAQKEKRIKATVAPMPAPPAPGKVYPPTPPPVTMREMENECDPYWDPDCLIDQPPGPVQEASAPLEDNLEPDKDTTDEGTVQFITNVDKKNIPSTYFDPYDFKRDLYDPFRYAETAPTPQ